MAVIDGLLALGAELERSYQVRVRKSLKFRVGQLVYVAFSLDESVMEFAFSKEHRGALVGGDPRKFQVPSESDLRFNWVRAGIVSLEPAEARELVVDAWRLAGRWKVRGPCRIRAGLPSGRAVTLGACAASSSFLSSSQSAYLRDARR